MIPGLRMNLGMLGWVGLYWLIRPTLKHASQVLKYESQVLKYLSRVLKSRST
jgi:hypothetical protein